MEAVGYLPYANQASQNMSENAAMPMARETVERHAYGQVYTMYKDDLIKELYKELYKGLGLQYGG